MGYPCQEIGSTYIYTEGEHLPGELERFIVKQVFGLQIVVFRFRREERIDAEEVGAEPVDAEHDAPVVAAGDDERVKRAAMAERPRADARDAGGYCRARHTAAAVKCVIAEGL